MHQRRKRSRHCPYYSGADGAPTSPSSSSSAINRFSANTTLHYSRSTQHTPASSRATTTGRRIETTTGSRATTATTGKVTSATAGTSTVNQYSRWRSDVSVAAMPRIPRTVREPYVDASRLSWACSHMGAALQSKVYPQLRVPLPVPPVIPTDPKLTQSKMFFCLSGDT